MSGLMDLVFYGWVAVMVLGPLRAVIRQRRIEPDSPEADEDLLDSIHTHWLVHSQLDSLTARRMRTELADHFADVRRSGGGAGDVVGSDLATFADEWAASHDAVGPWAGLPWRVASFALGVFTMAMIARTLELLGDGRSEIGYLQAAVLSLAAAVPLGVGFPFLGRLSAGPAVRSELRQLAVFVVVATPFSMAFLGLAVWLFSDDNIVDGAQRGSWSLSTIAVVVAGVAAWYAMDRSDPQRSAAE